MLRLQQVLKIKDGGGEAQKQACDWVEEIIP